MRLLELTVRNFRGFGDGGGPVSLDADLVLFYGPNAYGKTSLSEAIEWLFYGTTKRRRRGDELNRGEYQGSFRNVHSGTATEVTARVRLSDGREHRLTRRIEPAGGEPERTVTLIDDAAGNFGSLGLRAIQAVYPIIVQHGLQTFIHTKPRDRRDAISAAFGLDELAVLKTALDGARRSFNMSPPPAVVAARTRVLALAQELGRMPATAELAERWRRGPQPNVRAEADIATLVAAARALTGEQGDDIEALLEALRRKRVEAAKQVFDASKLMPPADGESQWRRANAAAEGLAGKREELANEIATAVATVAAYSAEALKLWEQGLAIASPEDERCPMCEADTLTQEKRAELHQRLKASNVSVEAGKKVAGLSAEAEALVHQARSFALQAVRPGMSREEAFALRMLLDDEAAALSAFVSADETLGGKIELMRDAAEALMEYLRRAAVRLSEPRNGPALVAEGRDLPQAFVESLSAVRQEAERYAAAWHHFEPALTTRIASSNEVATIDAVGKALRAAPEVRRIAAYDDVLTRSLTLMQSVEAALKTQQEELFATRGSGIVTLYDLMNPAGKVRFARMVPATDNLRLEATSFGVDMSAAANLSECQLNCLGLAVAMMQATSGGSPFGFVVLDDPVQAMDDEHCEALLASVLTELLDTHGKQVVLLSHLMPIVDRARALNIERRVQVYHFENYTRAGPEIVEQVKLRKQISEIRGLMAGNEANRSLAVDRLRVLVEATVRELYVRRMGQPVPATYDTARPSELLRLFQSIPGTLPREHQGLSDTVGFCDPAHHTDAGYTVPTRGNIQPHLDRVVGLINRYSLS